MFGKFTYNLLSVSYDVVLPCPLASGVYDRLLDYRREGRERRGGGAKNESVSIFYIVALYTKKQKGIMTVIKISNILKSIGDDLQKHYRDYYAGKLRRPCDDDCSEGCNGGHNYALPDEWPDLFTPQSDTNPQNG